MRSLQVKFSALVVMLLVAACVSLALVATRHERGALEDEIEKRARTLVDKVRPAANALRVVCDRLESTTAAALWPFPTYHQMLFQ